MSHSRPGPHIFLSVAEHSADLHAAALIQAIQALCPTARFTGIAGPKMQQAGCASLFDMTEHSSMLTGSFRHLHHGYKLLSLARQTLRNEGIDAAVVVDSPILNLRVAKIAKSFGIQVLYYIAPQIWAWGGAWRIRKVQAAVDRLACILPFEEPYFRAYGLEASYVGHPLFASLLKRQPDPQRVQALRAAGRPVLTIMPGSRQHVAAENFPGQLKVAAALRDQYPNIKILASVANPQVHRVLEQQVREQNIPVELHESENAELLSAADLALVSSGTVTLETAYYHTPMIVMYNSSRVLYQFARWFITTRHLSLPNVLAARRLVPEFMPYYTSIGPIVEHAAALLADEHARRQMSADLAKLVRPFLNSAASETTAKILLDLIESSPSTPRADLEPAKSFQIA